MCDCSAACAAHGSFLTCPRRLPKAVAMHQPVSLKSGHGPARRPCDFIKISARSSPQNSGGQETDGGKAISACGSGRAGENGRLVTASEALLCASLPVQMLGSPLRCGGFLLWASSSAFRSSAEGVINSEPSAEAPCVFPELRSNTEFVSTSSFSNADAVTEKGDSWLAHQPYCLTTKSLTWRSEN